jgi:hypothetical protein
VRGVETAPQQADSAGIGVQGRTCPVPRTCHL